jgi:group II intron reverse transcriptase/maturase
MLPLEEAQKYLEIVSRRGKAKTTLNRVYANIKKHKGLFLMAYANLYANKGALTPGTDPEDTVDGMSVKRIESLIERLHKKEYQWTPVRRTYIKKRDSQKLRPLGLPGWNDKLLQEVIRLILSAYYEPQFRESSHGFREGRGCHTALKRIQRKGKGTKWFIEGDIKGCFDNIRHKTLMRILKRKIKDKDFRRLIWGMLKAGYMENWTLHKTYSGTPQGGIASPLLANIILNELDEYIEDILIPQNTRGKKRKWNPDYRRLTKQAEKARNEGNWLLANRLRHQYTQIPRVMTNDPDFRRLWYVRYADDFLLGYAGTKKEAETIKQEIRDFLGTIALEMSAEKTLITNAHTEKARFLNYEINATISNAKRTKGKRSVNRMLWFSTPQDVIVYWKNKVQKKGKIIHRAELQNVSDYEIIRTYEVELQGLINYYSLAHNVKPTMSYLRYIWQESLLKTLAAKHKMKKTTAHQKHQRFYTVDNRRIVGVEIARKGKKPLIATFGKKPIQRKESAEIQDDIPRTYPGRNDLLTRMLADICELCGSSLNVQAHHVKKLADLKKKYKGRKEKPEWVQRMIMMRRKTLFVCRNCHNRIHGGTYDGAKLTRV